MAFRDIALIAIVLSILSCGYSDELKPKEYEIVSMLNTNILALKSLAEAYLDDDFIVSFSEINEENGKSYRILLGDGNSVAICTSLHLPISKVPKVSLDRIDDSIVWLIDDAPVIIGKNASNPVDITEMPIIQLQGGQWVVRLRGETKFLKEPDSGNRSNFNDLFVAMEDELSNCVSLVFSENLTLTFPTSKLFADLQTESKNKSYYKDLFVDAGFGLTDCTDLPAADFLNLSVEYLSLNETGSDVKMQRSAISGSRNDINGGLLFPDGQPRFRTIIVCGGSSKTHGQSLGTDGLQAIRKFVQNGGSYVGICAGAFLVGNGYDSNFDYEYYLHLWPGVTCHTGLEKTSMGMFLEPESPLLLYYDFGGDGYVANVHHNHGGYVDFIPDGTEVLARYDNPEVEKMHLKPSVWSYKPSKNSGRMVMVGSHPESYKTGERMKFMASLISYASDGAGTTALKGILRNGYTRTMDQSDKDIASAYSRIGDGQCHHFAIYVPKGAKRLCVSLNTIDECDNLQLGIRKDGFAFLDVADYKTSREGKQKDLFMESIEEGLWYVSVQSESLEDFPLNGVSYSVSVCWDETDSSFFPVYNKIWS